MIDNYPYETGRGKTFDGAQLETGKNKDPINVAAGIAELKRCGYDSDETHMVIEYALMRWARGEEEQAERGAIDSSFHGITLTCWKRLLAAAMAGAR